MTVVRGRVLALLGAAALSTLVVAGCTGSSGIARPSGSGRPSLPSIGTPSASTTASALPTRTLSRTPTPTPTPTPSPTPVSGSGSTGTPAWLWWLLAAALAVAAVAGYVIVSRSRAARQAWASGYADGTREARWLADELLPTLLLAGTAAERHGGWAVARPRAVALEARLGELAATGSDEADVSRVRQLGAAVTGVRAALDAEGSAAEPAAAAEAMGAVRQSHRQLQETLRLLAQPQAPKDPGQPR